MKSQIILGGILSLTIASLPLFVSAESGDISASWTTTETVQTNALLLSGITIEDDAHIQLEFTQNIIVDSVRIRIAKQSDGTNIKVESLTGVLNTPSNVFVTLTDLLESDETYTLTLISALSDKWVTITDGTDALSEFIAPNPLKQSMVVFDAAPNPEATIVTSEVAPPVETTTETAGTEVKVETPVVEPVKETLPENTELPLTGMNPLFFIIISSLIAIGFIIRKKQY